MTINVCEISDVKVVTRLGPLPDFWQALLKGKIHTDTEREWRIEGYTPGQFFHLTCNLAVAKEITQSYVDRRRVDSFYATTKGLPRDSAVQPFTAEPFGYPVVTVSNACVSGAQAVIEATDRVNDGDCDGAIVVAADAVDAFVESGFTSLQARASTVAKPFDRSRDGLTLGGASAAVKLGRPSGSATPRIISYGCSNDANHISGPSRDGGGLALAIERALVGIDRREIRAICAHGTATQYNDAMEARAFHTVFGGSPPPVFGIKGAIGHTLGAAGLIEVIISAKVAVEGVIPPTTGYEQGEQDFPLDIVHGKPRKIKPGLVLTTNSGFGGMNTAIIVGPGAP
jgi:3-oxoacyl-[acyl-carrier-protein] synthase II